MLLSHAGRAEVVQIRLVVGGRRGTDSDAHPMTRILVLLLLLQGCAVLADKRVAAGCQVADGFTTKQALDRGAVEANPFLKNMDGNQIVTLKVLIAGLILWAFPRYEEMSDTQKVMTGALSIVGCGAAIHNNGVQR